MDTCPICEQDALQIRSYSRDMQHKGVNIVVHDLQCDYCKNCTVEVVSPEQLDRNAKLIREAFIAERARVKREQDLLTGAEIRLIREKLGITQKQASKIFGGGLTAFAKYEAEDVIQSAGMDKLIRLAEEIPAAAEWLFKRAGETKKSNNAYREYESFFRIHDLHADAFLSSHKIKIPDWFAEDGEVKHGKFDLNNLSLVCLNDGSYADAA